MGIAVALLAGAFFIGAGWVVVVDWRQLGSRMYRFNRLFPGGLWYEKRLRGFRSFQVFIGWGYVAFGALLMIVAMAILVSRL